MYSSAQSVDDELSHTDEDTAHTLITNTKDLLTVAACYDVDVLWIAPSIERILDVVGLLDIEEAAFWSPKEATVISDGVAFL
jgi:hypothetical protein